MAIRKIPIAATDKGGFNGVDRTEKDRTREPFKWAVAAE